QPQGNAIYGLVFQNDQTGWAVARGGNVLRTDDGAMSWQLIPRSGVWSNELLDILILNDGTLIACGDGLYRSTDGGWSWEILPWPGNPEFRSLEHIPGGGISAASIDGQLLVSFNHGDSWLDVGPGSGHITNHFWKSSTEVYVVGSQIAQRTTDGGTTWTTIVDELAFYDDVFFTDDLNGIITQPFNYWRTSDGGDTWVEDPLSFDGPLYRFRQLTIGEGFFLVTSHGEGGALWETFDAGLTWTDLHQTEHTGFTALAALPSGRIVVAADNGDIFWSDNLLHSLNAGTFNAGAATVHATITKIGKRPDGVLFAFGTGLNSPNAWLRSDDHGLSWNSIAPPVDWPTQAMAFQDNSTGLFGGYNQLSLTTDGGVTWSATTWPGGGPTTALAMPAANAWYVAVASGSSGGSLKRSRDSGNTWLDVSNGLPVGNFVVTHLSFFDSGIGIVAGIVNGTHRAYRTIDGGESWNTISLPDIVYSISWIDSQNLYAGLPNGIYQSVDGGLSWRQVLNEMAHMVVFKDAQNGIAYKPYQNIFITSDGGDTWDQLPTPFLSSILDGSTVPQLGTVAFGDEGWIFTSQMLRILVGSVASLSTVNPEPQTVVPSPLHFVSAHPNPFNPMTRLSFNVEVNEVVQLSIYDVSGKLVRTIVNGPLEAGLNTFTWDGQDHSGRMSAAGIYLARISGESGSDSVKIVLAK
ncbi:MAG: T9SS type A sorting domain-containing protein, partial [Gammaproteobacteria bacterium]|nr:T9SS type A sorting domain-containing protein [Gammaproteobacteria bacterium]